MISEELAWGVMRGHHACVARYQRFGVSGIMGNGTPEQIGEWVPECFGTEDDIHVRGVRGERSRRRLRPCRRYERGAVYDEAKDEWCDQRHQKRGSPNGGNHARAVRARWSSPRVEPDLQEAAATRRSSCRRGRRGGQSLGQKVQEDGDSRPATRPRSCSTTCASPGRCLLGGKEKLDNPGSHGAREGQSRAACRPAMRHVFEASRPLVGAQADRHRTGLRTSTPLEYAKQREAFGQADHHEPGDRRSSLARRHEMHIDAAPLASCYRACWMGSDPGKEFTGRRRLDVESCMRVRGRGEGDRRKANPDPSAGAGYVEGAPRSSSGTATRRSTRSRRHEWRSSALVVAPQHLWPAHSPDPSPDGAVLSGPRISWLIPTNSNGRRTPRVPAIWDRDRRVVLGYTFWDCRAVVLRPAFPSRGNAPPEAMMSS